MKIWVSIICFICITPQSISQENVHTEKFLFYLHGKIVEDQGVEAVSRQHGPYEYNKIIQTFNQYGFTVFSQARKKNSQPWDYADKVVSEINALLKNGVSPNQISVIGASKGAAIAILVSHLLKNDQVNFVLIAICNDSMNHFWEKNDIHLWGRILYIYDKSDRIAGSCEKYREHLKSVGLTEFKELKLNLGLGHGILYRPLKEWVEPAVNWSNGPI